MKAELWVTLGMLRLPVQVVGPSVGLRAGTERGERLLGTSPSWRQDAQEIFLEGSSLTEVRLPPQHHLKLSALPARMPV